MGIEAGSTNRWRTARERNRLQARYLIQSRVISRVNNNEDNVACSSQEYRSGEEDGPNTVITSSICDGLVCTDNTNNGPSLTLEEMNTYLKFLQAIIKNDLSAFSVAQLAKYGHLLNKPLPADIHAIIPRNNDDIDVNEGIPKDGARTLDEAFYAMTMMLSKIVPWELTKMQSTGELIHKNGKLFDLLPQPTTLATSKYGQEYVTKRLVPYMELLRLYRQRQLTVIEYASLLGRHGIVALLLLGGLDPTCHFDIQGEPSAEVASRRVLSLFHSVGSQDRGGTSQEYYGASCVIPLSIWSYIIRAVIEMRMNAMIDGTDKDLLGVCHHCQHEIGSICFGSPCYHTFCEPCMWNHLVDQVPRCTDLNKNVVTCPMCEVEFEGFQFSGIDVNIQRQNKSVETTQEEQNSKAIVDDSLSEEKKDGEDSISIKSLSIKDTHEEDEPHQLNIPLADIKEQRRLESLAKFMKLPESKYELKNHKKNKRKRNHDAAHGTWRDALQHMIEGKQTRDVRIDRFFRAILTSPHLATGYIEAGIDLNVQNEYGQTPLYLSCWKGSALVVKLLLDNGADAGIAANGGSTCYNVAAKYQRDDVLHLLDTYSGPGEESTDNPSVILDHDISLSSPEYEISVLIDLATDHPGAGACIIDNALTEQQLQHLEKLWQSLPIADTCDDVEKAPSKSDAKSTYRPSRSYFCDVEEKVQTMLEGCVQAARAVSSSHAKSEHTSSQEHENNTMAPSSVFQHIRFLNYERPGGLLPAHVDLCRVDETSGLRSTHTFILYMTDCEKGGGTALLKNLKNPEVLAVAQPKRGRALLFPHLCPHAGLEVECAPKLLLRGEVILG